MTVSEQGIEHFLLDARPALMRAFGPLGSERAEEALSAAFEWAFNNWQRLATMDNPVGYLYRVGATRSIPRKEPIDLPPPADVGLPDFEPRLIPALLKLPETQRTAVWLVHGCGWTYPETAYAMDIGESTVGTHVSRALSGLRREMKEKS